MNRLLHLLVAALVACSAHAQESPDAKDARAAVAGFERAWNQHDMEAFAGLFTEDADFVNIEGTRWRGRTAIKEAHAFVHASIFKQSHLDIVDVTIRQLGPDVIVARATWHLEGQTTMKGAAVPARSGILTTVLTRSGSGWKIDTAQNTDIDQ